MTGCRPGRRRALPRRRPGRACPRPGLEAAQLRQRRQGPEMFDWAAATLPEGGGELVGWPGIC